MKKEILLKAREWKPRLVRVKTSQRAFAFMMDVTENTVHRWMQAEQQHVLSLPISRFIQIEEMIEELEKCNIDIV